MDVFELLSEAKSGSNNKHVYVLKTVTMHTSGEISSTLTKHSFQRNIILLVLILEFEFFGMMMLYHNLVSPFLFPPTLTPSARLLYR